MAGIGESGHSPGPVSAYHPKPVIRLEWASTTATDPKQPFVQTIRFNGIGSLTRESDDAEEAVLSERQAKILGCLHQLHSGWPVYRWSLAAFRNRV